MAFGDRRIDKGKAGLNRTLKSNTKSQLQKALGGDLVSDREVQQFDDQTRASVDAGLRSQQVALNQAAAGAGEGSASEQITLDAAQTAQKESADAAIKSEGQSMAFREGATAQRKQAALSQAESQRAEDTRRRQQAMKYSMDLVNTAGSAVAELL